MSCFRFFDKNYADLEILANNDFSSQQSAFPVVNAYNTKRRAKVWRSNGYYEVTASNNNLIFRETSAVELTATIAVGNYTRANFLTAIKTALETIGDSTYTVTFTSNFKISIASNGSGGGGIFELVFDDALNTCEDLLGFDSFEYTGALTFVGDSIKLHTSEWILWDLAVDSDPQAFALIDSRNDPLSISPTATVRLQGNHTNVWTSPVYNQLLTYDDRILHTINGDGIAGTALRYWRVLFQDQNPKGYIQVGSFFLGQTYSATRGAPQFPFVDENIDRTDTVISEGGQTFSEIKPKTARFSTDWFGLTVADKEYIQDIFDFYGTGLPFFISMDTPAGFSSSSQYYIRYVKFANAPRFELVSPKNYRASISFEEQL